MIFLEDPFWDCTESSPFTTASRPALEPTQFPIHLVPGAVSEEYSCLGMKLTIRLHIAPSLGIYGVMPTLLIRFHDVVLN